MDEIKKLNLDTDLPHHESENGKSGVRTEKKKRFRLSQKSLSIIGIVLVLLVIFSIFGVVLPAQKTYKSAQKTYTQAKKAWDALKKQNVAFADEELAKTKTDLTAVQKDFQAFSYLRFIPFANNYYNDADHMIKAGIYGIEAADIVIDSVKPYADVLGLKGQGSFVMGSAEQRIQTAIMTMGKITPKIDEVADKLLLVQKEIDQVDPNHYPSLFGIEKVKKQLITLKQITDEGVVFVNDARPLIKVLPELLGEQKEKRYLVLFQNDKELRPTGGFITAYSIFRVEKGIIHVERSDDIYTLDNAVAKKPQAPEGLVKYLPKTTVLNLRDANVSPDFVESMDTFYAMYQSAGAPKVDGIIALDTHVLVSTIKILDDEISAGGITFTTKIDKRCDCPQVIYELEDNISRPVNYIKTGRKDLLGVLLYAIMEKALKSSPKLYWGPLIQESLLLANQKHVLFYLFDTNAQSGIEALGAGGRIRPFEGDYFHMSESNLGGAKSNLYVKQEVQQEYTIGSDGTITKTITFLYKNDHAPSDCNLERGGLCLNATLRDWFRIYVPKGSVLGKNQGSEVKMVTKEDLGKTVFEGFLTVRPLGQKKLVVTYTLPFKAKKGSSLPVLIQKQPGTKDNAYTILLNSRKREEFPLLTDKEFVLKP